ncbi:MAG: hypothetical protein ACOX2R_05830 [Anaerolineae bacterium]
MGPEEQAAVELGAALGKLLVGSLWVIVGAIIVFLIVRSLVLWYWRINHIVERLDAMREDLHFIARTMHDERTLPAVPDGPVAERGPDGASS